MSQPEVPTILTRRNFLGTSACSAMSTAGLLSTILSLRHINALAADTVPASDPYKAIVCVFLYGGNDSGNLLIPRETSAHAKYVASRSVLGLPLSGILPLNALNDKLVTELGQQLDAWERNKAISCVIITGAGRAFAAVPAATSRS